MVKAKGYTLHPEGVNFVNVRKAHKIVNDVRKKTAVVFRATVLLDTTSLICCTLLFFCLPQRLYREDYHKQKDKIHTTYDTPDIKQVKMNQEHLSDVRTIFRQMVLLILLFYLCLFVDLISTFYLFCSFVDLSS